MNHGCRDGDRMAEQDFSSFSRSASVDRPVSLLDLGPTVLSLAGLATPSHMQGRAFLGTHASPPRVYVPLFRGRMDERYDCVRAIRDRRFFYRRNYMPHRIYGQHVDYLWQAEGMPAWQAHHEQGGAILSRPGSGARNRPKSFTTARPTHTRCTTSPMRHSRMELTNTYYTDSALLDVAGP
ncbi:MAG: hypothetical protein WDZ31_11110 [Phycisphaeraceae bacterium]